MEVVLCICRAVMVRSIKTKRVEVWECESCCRLLVRQKQGGYQTWYVAETTLRGSWRIECPKV